MAQGRAILSPSDQSRRALPVELRSYADESGLGFLYRTFASNGLRFHDVGRYLGIKHWGAISENQLAKLALLTGCNQEDLTNRCCLGYGQRPNRKYRLMGHLFGEGSVFIQRSARICPLCIKRTKYAKAAWLIRSVVGCCEHHLLLSERCFGCGRLVSWNRPAIDVCECGRFLSDSHSAITLPVEVAGWNQWVQLRFDNKYAEASDFQLPRSLNGLSLDSCGRLIFAFGLLEGANSSLQKATSLAGSCSGMAEVIRRGIERYGALETESKLGMSLLDSIHMPALDRLRFSPTCADDARSIRWVFCELMRKTGRPLEGLGRYPRGQLSLF